MHCVHGTTHPDLSHKQAGFFLADRQIGGQGGVEEGVVVVDIRDHDAHGGGGRLQGGQRERKSTWFFCAATQGDHSHTCALAQRSIENLVFFLASRT